MPTAETTTHYPPYFEIETPSPLLAALLDGLIAHLPREDGWIVTEKVRKCCAILRAITGPAAGLEIDVRLSSGRVIASMCTQAGPTGARYLHRDHPAPQITCDPRRSTRQIAADITRRLLPPARRLFVLETEAIQQMWNDAARKEETIKLLEQITGKQRSPNFSDTIHLRHGEARVSGADSVNIELRYLDLETAADILHAIYGR